MSKKNELIGILWFVVALFLLISLLPHYSDGNYLGKFGKYIALAFFYLFGFGSYLFPFVFCVVGYLTFKEEKVDKPNIKIIGGSLFLLSICLFLYLITGSPDENKIGYLMGISIISLTSRLGGYLIFLLMIIAAIYLLELEMYPKSILSRVIFNIKARLKESGEKKKQPKIVKEEKEPIKIQPVPELPDDHAKEKKLDKKLLKKEKTALQKDAKPETWPEKESSKFEMPEISFLDEPETAAAVKEDFKITEEIIVKTLQNFGINVEILRTVKGPVVTRYEVKPAPGTKVNKIVSLSNDLALALKATHIRIIAPIPGLAAVGIEIPNKKYTLVSLNEIIQSEDFKNPDLRMPVTIGKSVDGENIVADLAEMPHLLVAGATGSGKSVCLNSIIVSLLYKFSPVQLKLLLIDPKRVEFTLYNDLPHLYSPVITDARKATDALRMLSKDMQERYSKLSAAGVRDIVTYNKTAEEKMPYVVVIIDELADLMLIAAREIEEVITRLSQLARGVGIHLVFATQRPSVDVITGVIKANFPSRIALQVFSKVDSRVILDIGGAEDLLGKGDMLFSLASYPKPVRTQCSYVSANEVKKVVDFWKKQGKPEYSGIESIGETGMEDDGEGTNELFKNALVFVKERKRVSATLLQGAFHISGGKAANLVSLMETKGLIGQGIGNKPRQIYFDKIDELLKKMEEK